MNRPVRCCLWGLITAALAAAGAWIVSDQFPQHSFPALFAWSFGVALVLGPFFGMFNIIEASVVLVIMLALCWGGFGLAQRFPSLTGPLHIAQVALVTAFAASRLLYRSNNFISPTPPTIDV